MLSSMLTIGYIRVASTDECPCRAQAQAQTIRERAAAEHADLELITDTGESARNMNRPGLRRMLSLIAGGNVQRVLVTRLDRLTRSHEDFAQLLERLDPYCAAL